MPDVYPDNLSARIALARMAFAEGRTTDGQPYPFVRRQRDEEGLVVAPGDRDAYLSAARWGAEQGHITTSELARIESVLTGVNILDSGWHVSADLAVKVVITKLCNELLNMRGDA
jgi:hypothetical protein